MGGLDHIEEHTAVGDIDGRTAQFLIEGGIVEQIKILEHQQTDRLIIRIQGTEGAQLIKRVTIHPFGVLYQFCYPFHRLLLSVFVYQLATQALKICSQMSSIILDTSSSCTELSDKVES